MTDIQPSSLHARITEALASVIDPEIRRPITDLGMVGDVSVDDAGNASVQILLTISGCPMHNTIRRDVLAAVGAVEGVNSVDVAMGAMTDEQRSAMRRKLQGDREEQLIPFAQPGNSTRVICVASGKGGVGKSSVTVNLAAALAAQGSDVGLLDADIYGHSIPDMLGLGDQHPTLVDNMIMPLQAFGFKALSMGMLKQNRDQVIAWRGPMLDRGLQQLLADAYWGDLDFLIIDLPPGTGDIAMSVGKKLPGSEVLVVTTPQTAAAEVAERAGTMAGMLNQKVLGVVENMSWLETVCPHCGQTHRVEVFGSGGGAEVAQRLSRKLGQNVPLVAQIPLDARLRTGGDTGTPVVVSDPQNPAAEALILLAAGLVAKPHGFGDAKPHGFGDAKPHGTH